MHVHKTHVNKRPHIISSNQTAVDLGHVNMTCDALFQISEMVNLFRSITLNSSVILALVFMLSSAHPEPVAEPPVDQTSSQNPKVPPEEPFRLCDVSLNRLQTCIITHQARARHAKARARDMKEKKCLLHGASFQHPRCTHTHTHVCVRMRHAMPFCSVCGKTIIFF